MNCAGGGRGNGLTLFATGLLACRGVLVAAKEQNGMLVGLTGNAVVRGLKRWMGGQVDVCLWRIMC